MPIETLDDIVENILDVLGVYGAHDDNLEKDDDKCDCRCCRSSSLCSRIIAAVEVDQKLHGMEDAYNNAHKANEEFGVTDCVTHGELSQHKIVRLCRTCKRVGCEERYYYSKKECSRHVENSMATLNQVIGYKCSSCGCIAENVSDACVQCGVAFTTEVLKPSCNNDFAKCAEEILSLDLVDAVINKRGCLISILRRHFK